MHLRANTLDDLLEKAFRLLLKSKMRVSPKKGNTVEEHGVVLELTSPRARLSRAHEKGHVFSCIGELFWYISCKQDFPSIQYYIKRYDDYAEPDGTIWGAYGPRMFGGECSQYEIVRDRLKERSATRKAVIQLFDREDIVGDYEDVPCTCTLQFLVRDGLLNLVVYMRSNDVYMGFPHDVFAFTMIQEIMANDLGVKLGSYKHMVGSFHLYDRNREQVERYLHEGFQPTREMPAMPSGNPWVDIQKLFVVTHHVHKTSLWSTLGYYNYLVFMSLASNAPLVRRTLSYFNIESDQLTDWIEKFASFPQKYTTYFVFDCQKMIFSVVKGGLEDLLSGQNFETVGTAGIRTSTETKEPSDSAKRTLLQNRFDKFVRGQQERHDASAVFSILIDCLPLSIIRVHDLTLTFKTRRKKWKTDEANGDNDLERVSLVDYIDVLLSDHLVPSNRIIFVHKFVKSSCRIPQIFVRNVHLRAA